MGDGMVATAGQRGDSPQFAAVLDQVRVKRPGGAGRPRTRPDRVRADKGHASAANRRRLRRRGVELLRMLEDLNSTDNTFFVIDPDDETLDRSISVHTATAPWAAMRSGVATPPTGQHDTIAEADHVAIVTEALTWSGSADPFRSRP
ncbi:transposase [Streptomyces sp. ISL-43]|uniref:transposase n=1 Tax=Streptomyces sp. ISL-43 TaxID=2819183 RepID=UPI0035A96B12